MILRIAKGILSFASGPLLSYLDKRLDVEKDRTKLKAGTDRLVYELDARQRMARTHWMDKLPVFTLCMPAAIYLGAVFIDSTFPSDFLNPLELPVLFKEHLNSILAYMLGIAVVGKIGR